MAVSIREATSQDTALIVSLVQELASAVGEQTPISPSYVAGYLAVPGCVVLLAEEDGHVVGLLSYWVRPNLFHAAACCLIEELVVTETARGRGIGNALMCAVLARADANRCAEICVTTMPDNLAAQTFYRRHGLVDEAIYLERHLTGEGRESRCGEHA